MWVILKFEKKKINLLKEDFNKKLGKNCIFYIPKMKIQKFIGNKLSKMEFNILGNYIFCFHKNLGTKNIYNNLQFCRGLKYFFSGCKYSQNEIKEFIEKCKSLEDNNGYIVNNLFSL